MRGMQYGASRFHYGRLGILDRPLEPSSPSSRRTPGPPRERLRSSRRRVARFERCRSAFAEASADASTTFAQPQRPVAMGPGVRRDDNDGLLVRFASPQGAVIVRLDRTIQYA